MVIVFKVNYKRHQNDALSLPEQEQQSFLSEAVFRRCSKKSHP